jgi:aminoglycoside phosphotransferase (APT) family kinase protein
MRPSLGNCFARSTSWGFFHCDRAARRYYDLGYLNVAEAAALDRLPRVLEPLLAGTEPRLLHLGDIMHHGNMIIDHRGRIAAVVDFVESTAGDPRWELAWVDFYFSFYPFARPSFDIARFRSGYGTDHDLWDDVGRFYTLAILLFEKLLFYRPDSRRGAWAIATVKELLKDIA